MLLSEMYQDGTKLFSIVERGAIAKCSAVQWEWMQLQIVHRKASHCHKLVNWAKLGPDKILDSDLFAFI